MINDSDTYTKNAILNNTQKFFDIIDHLKDFLVAIIEIIKMIKDKEKTPHF